MNTASQRGTAATTAWWSRKRVGTYLPPVGAEARELREYLQLYDLLLDVP